MSACKNFKTSTVIKWYFSENRLICTLSRLLCSGKIMVISKFWKKGIWNEWFMVSVCQTKCPFVTGQNPSCI